MTVRSRPGGNESHNPVTGLPAPLRILCCLTSGDTRGLYPMDERCVGHAGAMIYWTTVIVMTRRLARSENGQASQPRWGQAASQPGSQPR
jgi:hypothetical protein